MTLPASEVWNAAGWTVEDGSLRSSTANPLLSVEPFENFALYAEVSDWKHFAVILRRLADETTFKFEIDRDSNRGTFVVSTAENKTTVLREVDLGTGLTDPMLVAASAVEVTGESEFSFEVALNREPFTFTPDKTTPPAGLEPDQVGTAKPTADSTDPGGESVEAEDSGGGLFNRGNVGLLSLSGQERWSWIALGEEPTLALPNATTIRAAAAGISGKAAPYLITSLSSSEGSAGDSITLSGTGFTRSARVEIGGETMATTFVDSETVRFVVAEAATSGPLVVIATDDPDNRTVSVQFRVHGQPIVVEVTPTRLAPAEHFRILGRHLTPGDEAPDVRLQGQLLEMVRSISTELLVVAPDIRVQDGALSVEVAGHAPIEAATVSVDLWEYYDLIEEAARARWRNGRPDDVAVFPLGDLSGLQLGYGGARLESSRRLEDGEVYDNVLFTHPPDPEFRFVHGFYRDWVVRPNARLILRFGLAQEARLSDGVRFSVHFYHRTKRRWYDLMPRFMKEYDGRLATQEIELDKVLPREAWEREELKEMIGAFTLRVEPGSSGLDDDAYWVEAKVRYAAEDSS